MTFTAPERTSLIWLADHIEAAHQLGTHTQNKMYTETLEDRFKRLVVRALREAARAPVIESERYNCEDAIPVSDPMEAARSKPDAR